MYIIPFPPYDFSFHVFTNKKRYISFCIKHKLWDDTEEEKRNMDGLDGCTSYTDTKKYPNDSFIIAIYLPKIEDMNILDWDETINHECIHAILFTYKHFGAWVGKKPEYHETFCWHHNYLTRQIKTRVYKIKNEPYEK